MRLQLRRPLAATAVLLAAVGLTAITAPSPALAAAVPARTVSVVAAAPVRPVGSDSTPAPAASTGSSAGAASASSAAPARDADDASSPTLGQTIKRIKLWQSLTSMGILVGSLVLVKRLLLKN